MKKKGNFRKVVSGLLAGMTMLSTVLSPMTAYAAEIQPEEKPPLYEEVKDLLDEDEVVTAKDYEIETGSVFDVKSDYTGLEIKDDNKVKVTFEEAKNDKDEDFTTDHADTYKAVYYVEPVNQEHPKYQISRKLIVREKATEAQTETAGSEAVTESETAGSEQQTEEAEDSEADSEITDIDADEFDDLVEQAQNQDTYDEEEALRRQFTNRKHLSEQIDLIDKAIALSKEDIDDLEAIRELGQGWVAEETLAIAIYCSLKYSDDFDKAIIASVNHSGDSDSTGTVTGNILGAYLGLKSIPKKYLDNLELKDVILEIADDLYNDCKISEYGSYHDEIWEQKYIYKTYKRTK
ncbi:ADP-ribosylglycohydrolase family protein [[Clostridium] innocuum]|uniref:ADP-ribosylglycohydrolase family protein n=1 Tax=Clostridium innocuum TaxID=1522 RepID=UPI0012B40D77|nr:ADP-ribosylglycohydrolase family protein [[Clostridium] innocuum]MSS24027.1 ADP-ribosylglycohydrolase family protein [[Clostridium] innocuum]